MQQKVTAQIGATQISIETGKIARLADGAVVVSCGDTMVMASAVSATIIKEGQDYFPLTVDYREKAAAAGKFPGGYFKREGRPTEKETLTSRMIDRPLRPLFPHGPAREMIRIQKELAARVGKPKREMPLLQVNQDLLEIAYRVAGDRIEAALYTEGKVGRAKAIDALREEVKASISEKHPEADKFAMAQAFDYVQKKAFRKSILEKQKRMDGRSYQDLRPITCEVGVLPRAHGSAIFQRGETQALALATLAPIEEAQMIDAYGGGEQSKRFILHYNFPPFI